MMKYYAALFKTDTKFSLCSNEGREICTEILVLNTGMFEFGDKEIQQCDSPRVEES